MRDMDLKLLTELGKFVPEVTTSNNVSEQREVVTETKTVRRTKK